MSWLTIVVVAFTNIMAKTLTNVIPLLWAGMIIGISLIATPIKFQAPLLDLPTALDVGRVTFAFFNIIEWSMLVTLLILSLLNKTGFATITILLACMLLQTCWILPVLNDNVTAIIEGNYIQPGIHHTLYGCFEIIKLFALFYLYRLSSKSISPKRILHDS